MNTVESYDKVSEQCKSIFFKKNKDYGTSWRILRPSSVTDQIFIKAQRIRSIQMKGKQMIDENIEDAFQAMVNYCLMAMIQIELIEETELNLPAERLESLYNKHASTVRELMIKKNHDYGEAWRDMRIPSITDMILVKLLRIKQIEENEGETSVSEGVEGNFMDIINYSLFSLIKLSE